MRLDEVAAALGARLAGDGDYDVTGVVHPREATAADQLALAMDHDLVATLAGCPAGAAVVAEGATLPDTAPANILHVARPRLAMAVLLELFNRPVIYDQGIHPTAVIGPGVELGEGVTLGAFVVVGRSSRIGAGTVVLPHVTIGAEVHIGACGLIHAGARIGDRVSIGDGVIIHHNASIGADGFSFVTPDRGSVESAKESGRVEASNLALRRINSIGSVIIGDGVEIGANTAIDRGTITATVIGRNTKIDNLVQIGHNVRIGEHCMICGQTGIAGSTVIGNRVVLAGGVGIADHLAIGDDAVVAAGSGVATNVPARTVVAGFPAVPRDRAFEQVMMLNRLKSLFGDVSDLKSRLKAVERLREKD